jgi:hypothetical protein
VRDDGPTAYILALALTVVLVAVVAYVMETRPMPNAREIMCADRLGVVWSVEDGVTERLTEWGGHHGS